MAADHEFHRPGPLKQTNKAHKTGRHRSKGAIENALKGKVPLKIASHKHKTQQRKEQRRQQMNQIRKNKRMEAAEIKRKLGGQNCAPFLVCILPMHLQIDPKSALSILENCDENAIVEHSLSGVTYINIPRFKQRFAFVIPPVGRGNELAVLDYLKVCDTTMLLTSAMNGEDEVFDKWGYRIYNMMFAQGIPSPILALMDMESINPKRRLQTKAAFNKFAAKHILEDKVIQLDKNSDGLNALRKIGGQKKNILLNKENRPHMFADKVEFIPSLDDLGILKVTGFLRGKPLDVNGLVHIPGLGDFQMNQIDGPIDPYKLEKNSEMTDTEVEVLAHADPQKQISLQSENIPDAMDAEQTWPTEEEIEESKKETKKNTKIIKRVPKGWSEYQAAWIPDTETVEAESSDDDESNTQGDNDDEFMSCDENSEDEFKNAEGDEEFTEASSISEAAVNDEIYDLETDLIEERKTLEKVRAARIDGMWPDEIDTPLDVAAKDRFQKYRGLESFRTSPWDVKESLPSDYARIFQFRNFDRTKKRIIAEVKDLDGVKPGTYITVHIKGVPADRWTAFKSAHESENLVVYGLLSHENKMSVMNVVLKRISDSEIPIKSKERLIIQSGYRRFVVNPIFSQHTNGSKHKFEKYFRPHTTVVATFYAPIQFPPAPVLCFKENPDTTLALVARGCVLSCNPDRVILKRIVLTGHPMRINRKSATIRFMFFNKEDVDYFKPVKLRTKCGRLGHIKESLGTHGHMKCRFDGQLKSFDTVLMNLYKRVYPKWTYEECLVMCEDKKIQDKME